MTPKQQATLLRFVKVTAFAAAAFVVTGALSFLTSNDLGLPDSAQTFVTLLIIPALAAVEKWLNWETVQFR